MYSLPSHVRLTAGHTRGSRFDRHVTSPYVGWPAARHRRPFDRLAAHAGPPQRPSGQRIDARGYTPPRPNVPSPQSQPPRQSRPAGEALVQLSKAAEWWQANVFRGLDMRPVEPKKLANGHAARPGHNTAGRPIQVVTNHLLLDVDIRTVGQFEVKITKIPKPLPSAPAPPAAAPSNASSASVADAGGGGGGSEVSSGSSPQQAAKGKRPAAAKGSSGRGGGGGGGVKVTGAEAHDVLSYALEGTATVSSAAQNAWVYDGGAALYTLLGTEPLAAVAQRQPDGSFLVELPAVAGGPAAGSVYKLELRRTAVLDVEQCLREAQQLRATGGRGGAAAGPPPPAPDEAGDEADEFPAAAAAAAGAPSAGGGGSGGGAVSSEAAALAVVELVSRAAGAWGPDVVRTGRGTYVSYKTEDRDNKLSGMLPLKLLNGFRSAVSLVAAGPTLTLDAAVSAVAEDGPLLPQLQKALGVSDGAELARQLQQRGNAARLGAALAGLEVKGSHTPYTYKLSGKLAPKPASQHKFKWAKDDGRTVEVTVQQYFKEKYGIVLRYPELPCVLARKDSALPLELLSVVRAQKRMSRLDSRQKAEHIRDAATRPADRLRAAREALRGPLQGLRGAVAAAFGLRARGPDFLKVRARLLPGPLLEVTRGSSAGGQGQQRGGQGGGGPAAGGSSSAGGLAPGNAGEWSLPGVAQAGRWTSGAVLCYLDPNRDKDIVSKMLSMLRSSLAQLGAAPMPDQLPVVWASLPKPGKDPDAEAGEWLRQAVQRAKAKFGGLGPQLVLVVLPQGRESKGVYDAVKAAGDGALGVPTQCIDPGKAGLAKGGPSPSYASLLALGVNAKLGGVTTRPAGRPQDWAPLLGGRRLMVLGADVSRGAAAELGQALGGGGGDDGEEEMAAAMGIEYAAVVGSVDSHSVRYLQSLSAQSAGNRDVIRGMRASVAALLRGYAANASADANANAAAGEGGGSGTRPAPAAAATPACQLPEVLLMYRDGVADSMFDAVLAEEYTAIKQACVDVGGRGYDPRVTFVMVQKRHNTRLFPDGKDAAHKSGNVLPGTAVDEAIVDDAAFDFFLNSHAGIQGTNRAPRYTVLVDEVGFTAEALMELTFTMCHTYPACNRSLSLPPSARLAHNAADRARVAFKGQVSGLAPSAAAARSRRGGGGGGGSGGVWYEVLSAPEEASVVL